MQCIGCEQLKEEIEELSRETSSLFSEVRSLRDNFTHHQGNNVKLFNHLTKRVHESEILISMKHYGINGIETAIVPQDSTKLETIEPTTNQSSNPLDQLEFWINETNRYRFHNTILLALNSKEILEKIKEMKGESCQT